MFTASEISRNLRPLAVVCAITLVASAAADEGMWLFNAPPLKQLKEKYQFEPTPQWLEHLQKASVRFNSGGSGSFVSAKGLVITNHHVGADTLQKISDPQHNYLKEGFYARTQADEIKSNDLELNVLMSIEDVTARVNGAVKARMTNDQASSARNSVIAAIEKESKDKTGLRSDVVTLYQGGAYHLYRYKRYDDVRLVFAPEQQMAFFGGDPDNFEYPRYDLDICLFRVYENGQPAKIDHYLKWNSRGPSDGELTFVSGSPGKTDRQLTLNELADMRDRYLPYVLHMFNRREVLELAYGARSFENARKARNDLFGDQNNRKRYNDYLAGLLDSQVWTQLQAREEKLRNAIARDPKLRSAAGAYDRIKNAQAEIAKNAPLYNYLEQERPAPVGYRGPRAFFGNLFKYARLLLRAVDEGGKPNGERIPRFRDSARDSLELELFSSEPVYDDYEILRLTDSLTDLASQFGADNPLVKKVLGGKSAARSRCRASLRNQIERRRRAQGSLRERLRRIPSSTRSDDRFCAPGGRARREKPRRSTTRKRRSKNRRMPKLRKRDLPSKERAAIPMPLSPSVFPTEPCAVMSRMENKFPLSPISPVYINVLSSTTTNHRSICRNVGSIKMRI